MAKYTILGVILLAIGVSGVMAGPAEDAVQTGNDAFSQGQYDEALAQYQISETESPESPKLDYNIANLMHEMGKYEEALDRYNGALDTQEAGLHANIHYNMGNTYYRMGDYTKAINSYTKALEANPDDMDAKLNLELARKMLKDNMQPNENKDQEQKQKQEQEQKEQQQQQQNEQEKQEQQKEQDQQSDQQQQSEQQDQQQDGSQQPDKPKEISKEDAERILNALKDDEQDVQKKIKRQVMGGDYTGNDW